MSQRINVSLTLILVCMLVGVNELIAQEKKSTKKITIIEETTNEDGSKTISTTVKEGNKEEISISTKGEKKTKGEKHFIKKKIHKKGHHDGEDIIKIKKGNEVKIEVEILEENGNKKIIIKKDGEEDEIIDLHEMHEKDGNVFIFEDHDEHDAKVIQKDGKKIIIRKNDGDYEETIELLEEENEEGNAFFIEKEGDFDIEKIEKDGKEIIIMKSKDGNLEIEDMQMHKIIADELTWVEEDANGPFIGIFLEANAEGKGILVTNTIENGPAEKAGLMAGDIITAINENDTENEESLYAVLGEMEIGEEISIKYDRDGKSQETKLKLADKAEFSINNKVVEIEEEFPFAIYKEEKDLKLGVYFTSDQGEEGLQVEDVEKGSVADKAGLQKGDVLFDFAGEKIEDIYDVLKMLKRVEEGDIRVLKVKRGDKKVDLNAKF